MCKCKQGFNWTVQAISDDDAMLMGYEGDLEDDIDTSDWVAYQIIVQKICSRCEAVETHDALGAVWVTPEDRASEVLRQTIAHCGMVPEYVKSYDLEDFLG